MVGSNNNFGNGFKQHCPICSKRFGTREEFEEHKSSPEHRIKWLKHWYQSNRLLLAQNKNGVVICPQSKQDKVTFEERSGIVTVLLHPGEQKSFRLLIKNTGNDPVILRHIEMLHDCHLFTLSDDYGVTRGERFVRVLSDVEYAVDCHTQAGSLGVGQAPVAFQFKPEYSDELFFITRTVQVNVVDSVAEDCAGESPYQRSNLSNPLRHEYGSYIPGIPLQANVKDDLPKVIPLKEYYYKTSLHYIAAKNFNPKKVPTHLIQETKKLKKVMEDGLGALNYVEWFQTMLWVEEMQMEIDIRYYSMSEVQLKQVLPSEYSGASCVELEVVGLAENRPSILYGDNVYVTLAGKRKPVYAGCVHRVNDKSVYLAFDESITNYDACIGPPSILQGDNVYITLAGKRKPVYAGCVHKVNDKSVYLAFDERFTDTFIDKMKVNVEFEFNRHTLRVSHRALILSRQRKLNHLLFPSPPSGNVALIQNIVPYNYKLRNNREQMQAVCNIVSGSSKPAPYIIFGPPGTGKTVTVVEAIKQVYKLQPHSRVLACAPSNAAADLITQRLLEHVSKNHMLRMHAVSRQISSIPDHLREVSNLSGNDVYFPTMGELMEFKIIVCTMAAASKIVTASIPSGHITHIFLDECGHAMEPEAIVPLAGIVTKACQVVLTGDPHQLGPVIRNSQCFSSGNLFSDNGLDKSYLERLMEMEMYQPINGRFNNRVVTKLLNNYRSHKDILKEPNEMFYKSELKVCADRALVTSLCNWEYLPKKNFPLIFHAVQGKDEREGNSPSFFNALEVSTVVDYVRKLLNSRSPKIRAREIGIITPYRRQVEKIRKQLRKVYGTGNVKVGSPEEFQGDERRVIIISTVRASADRLADDQVFKLGFLRNPKRFNVAVTRSRALLILVGCPEILCLDEHWGKLLDFIQQNGGYCGRPFTRGSLDDLEDILTRFDNLSLRPVLGEDVSARELAEAPEWRVEY